MSLSLFGWMLADPSPDTLDEFPMLRWWHTLTD